MVTVCEQCTCMGFDWYERAVASLINMPAGLGIWHTGEGRNQGRLV